MTSKYSTPRHSGLVSLAVCVCVCADICTRVFHKLLCRRSLLLMPFGLAATLSCLAPLYEPLIALVARGTRPQPRAVLGAVAAFFGVAVLFL